MVKKLLDSALCSIWIQDKNKNKNKTKQNQKKKKPKQKKKTFSNDVSLPKEIVS